MLSYAKSIPEVSDDSLNKWEKRISNIQKQISEEMIRVAVVGTIKSGKSTFVNSLFEGDYLKRGAGVVTSIVTRIRRGENLKANLYFKSWEDVNRDMEHAMTLFPSTEWRTSENKEFDIREEKDRIELGEALNDLNAELQITHDTRNMKSVLLSSYLKGYERVKDILSSDTLTRIYENENFVEHKAFVGDDTLAVYLKDIQLEIPANMIDVNIEIADCQGSDSPNPMHLAMIQDYLLLTHLIIYVISSRTGLRQADIRFLSIIKKMGLIDNILFVINTDFGEHESADDLSELVTHVEEELSFITPEPEIYTLSALFNLFTSQRQQLSDKDRLRLSQWEIDIRMVDFSKDETWRFYTVLSHKIKTERYFLLLKNHLERMGIILSKISHWVSVHQDILVRDSASTNDMIEEIKRYQKQMDKITSMIKSTFDGAVQKVKQELRADVDRFFDPSYGMVLNRVIEFIRGYTISHDRYESDNENSKFSNHLYLMFQEFRQALDMFMAETVNPEIIRFVRKEEATIIENLESISEPYDAVIREAIEEYNKAMARFGIPPIQKSLQKVELPDMNSIKELKGLTLPPASASMDYNIKITSEALMRLGVYRVIKILKRLFNKPIDHEKEDHIAALKAAISRLKSETEKSVVFHFKDYRENMKFQYIFKLADAVADILYDILLDRFQTYTSDLSTITGEIGEKQIDKKQVSRIFKEMEQKAHQISEQISEVKERMYSQLSNVQESFD